MNKHIHQEINYICVLCGADLTPSSDAPPDIGITIKEEVQLDEEIS